MNVPSCPDTVSRNMPVSWLRTTTVTPGSTAPCGSMTLPRSSVVPCCADADMATSRVMKTAPITRCLIVISLLGLQPGKTLY